MIYNGVLEGYSLKFVKKNAIEISLFIYLFYLMLVNRLRALFHVRYAFRKCLNLRELTMIPVSHCHIGSLNLRAWKVLEKSLNLMFKKVWEP